MPENRSIDLLQRQFEGRPFRVAEGLAAGVSRTTLHRLREEGLLESAGRGVLQLPGAGLGMLSDLAIVSARVPAGTVCLNSALAFWDLTDEIPGRIHIAVPRGSHRPTSGMPPIAVHVFAASTFELERQLAETDVGEPFRVYSAERSVVDAVRMGRWVGHDVGLQALRRYIRRPAADPARLAELARTLGGSSRLRPALEALVS
jgi:predicted transcriptional regulator of viral defense system